MKKIFTFFICVFFINTFYAQNFIEIKEKYGKKNKEFVVKTAMAISDYQSIIEIAIDKAKMRTGNVTSVRLKLYILRDSNYVDIPNSQIPSAYWDIFPRTNPRIKLEEQRTQFTISNVGDNETRTVDLKDLQFIKKGDILTIVLEPNTGNSFSYNLRLIELGLTWPNEIGLPLMVSFIEKDRRGAILNVGVSGIWHVNTRAELQNYFGFGLTITTDYIELPELLSSDIGIIPTVAIGLGRKNPDIFFLGAGYIVGTDRPIFFAAINLSWITRLIKR